MDEQRLKAYTQLIKAILNCPSGEEMNILQANPELVDAGLVQVMRASDENAGWLRNFAQDIETANYELPRLEKKLTADALLRQGSEQYQHSEYPQAWESLQQSLALYEAIGDKANIALCWGQLGCIERDRGNWDEAERLYQQSLALRTELGDRAGMATSWGQLGSIQRFRGNWDEAERLYQQSLALSTELGDLSGVGYAYNALAFVHQHSNKISQAFAAWRKGLAACPPERFPVEALFLGSNLGDAAFEIKDWRTAIEGYEAAIAAVETSCTFAPSYQKKTKTPHRSNRGL